MPIQTLQLANGLTLLIEPMPSVASAAMTWLIPAGSATDPPEQDGMATMLSELVFRGAGELDSRPFSEALDRLGVDRNCSVLTHHLRLSATMLGARLAEALPLLVDVVRRPKLPESALDPVRNLCLQTLDGLVDDPQHLVMLNLRQRHLPAPLNRHGYGERDALESITIDELRQAWSHRFVPGGSILAFAGAIDPRVIVSLVRGLLDDWQGSAEEVAVDSQPQRGQTHLTQDSSQMHLGVAWDAPAESDPHSMIERLGISVLSGGSSARLFTEVRQKRSLCYSVGASYAGGRDRGHVAMYAGTTPQRAAETLNVSLGEIDRLAQGATAEEFARARIGLKSHLVMQGESTGSRAAAIAIDQYRLGRARTLQEVAAEVEAITLDQLNAYLAGREPGPFTTATIGPTPLQTSTSPQIQMSK